MKALYKRNPDFTAWDLDAGSRKYVDQSTPAHRRLKKNCGAWHGKEFQKFFLKPIDILFQK